MASGYDGTLTKLLHRCEGCRKQFDTIVNRPKQRICGHSFCNFCINKSKKCPNCQTVSPGNWTYPENTFMIELNEKYLLDKKIKYTTFIKMSDDLRSNIIDLNKTYNKHLDCLNLKINKYQNAKRELIEKFSNLNDKSRFKSYSFEDRMIEVATMMSELLEEDFEEYYFSTPLTNFNPIEIEVHNRPFVFNDNISENILALKYAQNIFIGCSINGVLMWGRVETVKNALHFTALRQMEEDEQPNFDATIIHFHSICDLITINRIFFFELEVTEKVFKSITKKTPKFPKTFKIYVELKGNFMENPLAKQFYFLCTGERASSYIHSEVTVSKDRVKIDDKRKGDLVPNIPDQKSQEWVGAVDSVCASRLSGDYSSFYILRTTKKNTSGDLVHIGDMTSGQHLFRDNMKCSVIDCGFLFV